MTAPVGDGTGWRALLRLGEKRKPLTHPIRLRQVALTKRKGAPPQCAVYFHELRAVTDVEPADSVEATIATGREANLFYVPERAQFTVALSNRGAGAVTGRVLLANLPAQQHRSLLGRLMTPPPGVVASGIHGRDALMIRAGYQRLGMRVVSAARRGRWHCWGLVAR